MSDKANVESLVFFLGGYDLEMLTIRELLEKAAPGRFHDKRLAWGARATEYKEEIGACLHRGETPVLVELKDDLDLPPGCVIVVDHHGARAGSDRPSSLHQVFDLLRLPLERWTHWFDLVAANDRGYIPALLEMGVTLEEIARIRAADRAAQGVTPDEEVEGGRALSQVETVMNGMLTLVRLSHTRTVAVTDRLEPTLGGPGYRNLLVISPRQVNFFGAGNLVVFLDRAFPRGWCGGALPERGFWGHGEPVPDVLPALLRELDPASAPG